MKPQHRIALAISGALLAFVAIVILHPEPEPQYNGKPLGSWLNQLMTNYPRMDH